MKYPIPTRRTTVDIGTSYEKHSLRYLNDGLGMELRRVGGAGDGGVDLRGWWRFSSTPSRFGRRDSSDEKEKEEEEGWTIRVVAQCKAERKSLGPRAIRELEGVISQLQLRLRNEHGHSSDGDDDNELDFNSEAIKAIRNGNDIGDDDGTTSKSMAILLSQSGFSKQAMLRASQSSAPLMLVHLEGGQPYGHPPTPSRSPSRSPNINDIDAEEGEEMDVAKPEPKSVWSNRALSFGIFQNRLELRREALNTGGVRVGLYMDGKRI